MIIVLSVIGGALFVLGTVMLIWYYCFFLKKLNEVKGDNFGVTKDQNKVYTKIIIQTIGFLLLVMGIVLALAKFYL